MLAEEQVAGTPPGSSCIGATSSQRAQDGQPDLHRDRFLKPGDGYEATQGNGHLDDCWGGRFVDENASGHERHPGGGKTQTFPISGTSEQA